MTLISWKNGPILKSGAVGTEAACCCGGSLECCCVGSSQYDAVFGDGSGAKITQIAAGETCSGTVISKPDPTQSCDGSTVTLEWCGLTVSWTAPTAGVAVDSNFPTIPKKSLALDNDYTFNVTSNLKGWKIECNRCVVRGQIYLATEDGNEGKTRVYYFMRRNGCDADPIVELGYDGGPLQLCDDEEPVVTVNFAP